MANLAGETDFAEDYGIFLELQSLGRRTDGQANRQVGRRLADLDAADNIDIDVIFGQLELGAAFQHSDQQIEPVEVVAAGSPLGIAVAGSINQSLNFYQ